MKVYEQDIIESVSELKRGGIILYPTDTIWGIGCLVTDEFAIRKIHQLKNRPLEKKLIVLVNDKEMLQRYVGFLSDKILERLEEESAPTTIIYPNAKDIADLLISETGSIAIRIVKDDFCSELIEKCGCGITSTSANISNDPAPASFKDISDEIKSGVDYIVNHKQSDTTKASPSKILLLKNNEWVEIRS
ncbi:MAG: threonylcarbamoyl-AMP synthase [Chitinophagales bacterium]|nr:threonylcarbamoyl-AMP synthase [Chitinophagales bacterium]